MLQSVATLVSVFIATGMIAVIAAVLADDWLAVTRALGLRTPLHNVDFKSRTRSAVNARAQVIRVRSQSAPLRAAA